MRIRDIVDEAISVTQYEETVKSGLEQIIKDSIAPLAHYALSSDLAAALSDENASDYGVRDYLETAITRQLERQIPLVRHRINDAIGEQVITTMSVEPIASGASGFAANRHITLDIRPAKKIAARCMEVIMDILYNDYDSGGRVKGLYRVAQQIGDGDRYYFREIYYKVDKLLETYTSTILHELVHVMQHNAQAKKGRRPNDYEYRSYLDKTKDEFRNLHSAPEKTDDRYYNMYLASPQEMAAFAHEAALKIIKDYSFNEIGSAEGFYNVDADDLVSYIDQITSNRFQNPKTRQEQMVRKRYIKLVYQEVQRYIQARIASFQKKSAV